MHHLGGWGLEIPVNAIAWIFASLIMALGLWSVAQQREARVSPLQGWFLLGAWLMAIPLMYPGFPFKQYALPQILGLFGGLIFLFSLYQLRYTEEQVLRILYLLLAAVLVEALIGLVQRFLLPFAKGIFHNGIQSAVYGNFWQRNLFASFMATGLAAAYWILANDPVLTRLKRTLLCAVLFLGGMSLVFAQSRVGLLGAAIALVLSAPLVLARGKERLILGVALTLAGAMAGIFMQGSVRVAEVADPRSVLWLHAVNLFIARPWAGYGFGSFERTFRETYNDARSGDPAMPLLVGQVEHPHNEFLFWGVEGGIVPIIGLAVAVAAFLVMVLRMPWRNCLAILGLVAPLVAHSQTEMPFYQSTAHWLLLLFLVFLADTRRPTTESVALSRPWFARAAAIAFPVGITGVMLTALQTTAVVARYEREGRKSIGLLHSVIHPLGSYRRYQTMEFEWRHATGLKTGDLRFLEEYVAWARIFVSHTPRPNHFINMVVALQVLGRRAEAERVRGQGLRLYPDSVQLRQVQAVPGDAPSTPARPPWWSPGSAKDPLQR